MTVFSQTSIARIRGTYDGLKNVVPQSLAEHLKNVAALAGHFASKANIPLSGYLVGLVHDLGKYSVAFQRYIRSVCGWLTETDPEFLDPASQKGKIDHSTAGAQHVWQAFAGKAHCKPLAQLFALCVFSHHSGLRDCLTPTGTDAFASRINKAVTKTHLLECLERCDPAIRTEVEELLQFPVIKEAHDAIRLLRGRIRERLDQDADIHDAGDNENSCDFQQGLLARFLLSCLVDADHTDSAEFEDPSWKTQRARIPRRPWDRLLPRLESHLAGLERTHDIDRLRQTVSEQCARRAKDARGLFTLTVPTGGGKTLASLRFALHHANEHQLDRIFYIIPYTSIIDQNARVAREILERDEEEGSIVLEHHSNILPREEHSEDESPATQWEKLAENWDAPVVFTTMVQFLETLFGSGTRSARRMHNLAGSVLIFDEVQTVPVRYLHMFCNAIDFLVGSCGASVVFCTATQPRLDAVLRPHQGSLPLTPEREIIANVPELFAQLRRVEFFDHCDRRMDASEIAGLALDDLRRTGSCLVVCNTKSLAERIYASCQERAALEGASLYCLSTHLCPAHRLEKLDAMRADLASGKPVLCVSTQLIECGVDISFGSVVRLAAGLDSILQAAGRCNRHGGHPLGRVHIVTAWEEDESLNYLRDIKDGRDIFLKNIRIGLAELLRASENDLTRPEIVATYFDHYFTLRHDVMSYSIGDNSGKTLLKMLGSNEYVAPQGSMDFKQSFASAAEHFHVIDQASDAVIVPYGEGESLIAELCSTALLYRKKELLRKAQRYSVNIFPHVRCELERQGALHDIQGSGILALDKRFYHQETGVVTQPDGKLDTQQF
ncbi:CRISPR-associated helicase Cas3' [Desulfovibrio sp. OttesenSCG-928-I05]|nr:CRISPR-associated helicase Cas3' [Desulfovibrio sp. OttesenSCG-928-I05]